MSLLNHDVIIPAFVALPLAVAFLLQVLARRRPALADALAGGAMVCLSLMAFISIGEGARVYSMGAWPTPIGIDLRLDPLAALLLVIINGVGLLACVYSIDYMRRFTDKHRYYSLFLFLVAGLNGVVLAGDLFNLYVLMEIAAIASYALVGFGGEHEELEAAFRYAVLGTLSSGLILIGIGLVYGVTGTLNMAHIATRLAVIETGPSVTFALVLLLCGFSLKAALVPFHAWLPDAHPSAPAPVSAMLSGVVIKAIGVYVLARLIFNVFGAGASELALLRWLGLLSMVAGGLLATGQWDMKRLYAYSSISQVGLIVLGLGLGTALGAAGALYHLLNHAVFKSLLFLNAGTVEYATGTRDLNRLGRLHETLPVTGTTSLVASMSVAGLPPFNGFWSKLIIIIACVQAGYVGLAALVALMSIVTLAYLLKVQRFAFFSGETPAGTVLREPGFMAATMIILAIACLALSLLIANGLSDPVLVGPARATLLGGVFSL